MAIVATFEIRSDLVTARTHNRIMREVWRRALLNHREKRLAKHYQEGAEQKYGYRPRDPAYTAAKLRVKGHRKPLVWSGQLQRFVRNNGRITATAKGGRLKTPVVRKRRKEFVGQYVREIESFTPEERREIVKEVKALYLAEVNKPQNRRQRRVVIRG